MNVIHVIILSDGDRLALEDTENRFTVKLFNYWQAKLAAVGSNTTPLQCSASVPKFSKEEEPATPGGMPCDVLPGDDLDSCGPFPRVSGV